MSSSPYVTQHADRFIAELFDLLRIPSISAQHEHRADMVLAAEFLKEKLLSAGADKAVVYPTLGHPIVYGEQRIDDALPTVLIYGHYDVQPPDPLDLWISPPFEPTLREGKIFARGACDDKGQLYMHIKALETMNRCGGIPYNLKFLIEGEEEIGSKTLETFCMENRPLLQADLGLISDTAFISPNQPSITVGLRGLSYLEVTITGPNRDLHSGVYGGTVANPIEVLCGLIGRLVDKKGRISIPGFYDRVRNYSEAERSAMAAPFDMDAYRHELGIATLEGEEGYTPPERTGIRPSLTVNGIWGGYTGEGAKTVLPSQAFAKISMRLVPDQHSSEATRQFTDYIKSIAPPSVQVDVTPHHGAEPVLLSQHSAAYRAASRAFEDIWGCVPLPAYDGGSIPVVSLFQRELGIDPLLMGFGLHSDAIHSPNEHYAVAHFLKGIDTLVSFHHHFAKSARV